MVAITQSIELIPSPWESKFLDVIKESKSQLIIVSPYIKSKPLAKISQILLDKGIANEISVKIVTNFAIQSLLDGSLDVDGILEFIHDIPQSNVVYLPSLHAKAYVIDERAAIITSANLTESGLFGNYEYGVLIRKRDIIMQIRNDLLKYANLGNIISKTSLQSLYQTTKELKDLNKLAKKSIRLKIRRAFTEKADETTTELLKARAKNKTTHAIFSDTILYLLERGPLRTTEMHPLIKQIHPDLCDNTIDRVIDEVHFGKKWKHYVRNAQQSLKRKRLIYFDGVRWNLMMKQ